jgi:hypothetical protein
MANIDPFRNIRLRKTALKVIFIGTFIEIIVKNQKRKFDSYARK